MTTDAVKTLVHALISSRVDYCNSVVYGVCEVHLRPLQSALNAAARLVTGKRMLDHIASTMCDDLHWLPVRQRILFKLCTLVSKCLRRTAPSYLSDMLSRGGFVLDSLGADVVVVDSLDATVSLY